MNLKILKWLIAHRDLLTQVVAAVRGFKRDMPIAQQWEIVDKVARLVIPALSEADVAALRAIDWDEDQATAFALGAEYSALGVDWETMMRVIIPILQVILSALEALAGDE